MYLEITNDIQVEADPFYVEDQSSPSTSYYFFAYNIKISNCGNKKVKILSRHWIINDGTGHQREVQGSGIVGQQPHIRPGDSFEFTSFCPLPTHTGNMRGVFYVINEDGDTFEIRIPLFFLRGKEKLKRSGA
jgi:ApaG protein